VKRSRSGRRWLLVDAGMNDLIRPALYGAHHRIEPSTTPPPEPGHGATFRVVGPVCESSDDFGLHRFDEPPPARVVIRDAGAYGFTMASEYNGRPLPTEVFLAGGRVVRVNAPRSAEAWAASRA
jgi:diaminopimelate decarboxylase